MAVFCTVRHRCCVNKLILRRFENILMFPATIKLLFRLKQFDKFFEILPNVFNFFYSFSFSSTARNVIKIMTLYA